MSSDSATFPLHSLYIPLNATRLDFPENSLDMEFNLQIPTPNSRRSRGWVNLGPPVFYKLTRSSPSRQLQTSQPRGSRRGSSSLSVTAPSPPESVNDGHSRLRDEDRAVSFEMTQTAPPTLDNPSTFRFAFPIPSERENADSPEDERFDEQQQPPVRSTAHTVYTEDTYLKKELGTWDVAALIMNKMIGAGFFTTPGAVLSLTGSKNMSLVLWFIGGLYSLLRCALNALFEIRSVKIMTDALSFSLYLEYGLNFKFNGGDLIYVSDTSFAQDVKSWM